jgi:GntR family transcriptional regulator
MTDTSRKALATPWPSQATESDSHLRGAQAQIVRLEAEQIVDHNSPVPYYFQLIGYIERRIKDQNWTAGQLLPSEQELCDAAGVSRTVVRQAIAELERKGLVTKQSGKRSTVAFPRYEGSLMQNLRGFYDDAVARGQRPTTKVLGLRVIAATLEISEALRLEEGAPVIELNRLRFLDDEPEVVVVTYLPQAMCPNLVHEDLANESLYRLLAQKYALRITQGFRTIKAIALDRESAKLLGVRTGSPALLLKSIGLLADGRPLEYFISIHRGDRAQFEVKLVSE